MKPILAVWVLMLGCAGVTGAQWKLVWSDEFDHDGLPDPSKWNYETGCGLRNNEEQYYTANRKENARIENGVLIIEARKERFKNPDFDPEAKGKRGGRRAACEFAEYTSA